MAIFYNAGEEKKRPGVYLRIVNRGAYTDSIASDPVVPNYPEIPDTPDQDDGLIVSYLSGVVTLTLPVGITVSHDGSGTVKLSGLRSVAYDDEGNVTIGG